MLKSPKLRLALSVALLAAGIGLPAWALQELGPPWSFQARAGVVLSATGTVEAYGGPKRSATGGALAVAPGLWLMPGDEMRVGALSAAVVRTPGGDLELADGARVLFGEEGPALARGLLRLGVAEGKALRVEGEGTGEVVTLAAGRYRLTADGKGRLYAYVEQGSATAGGGVTTKSGELLLVSKGSLPLVSTPTDGLSLEARVEGERILGEAAPGAQLFVNGRLVHVAGEGRFSEALPPGGGDVVLFARDPAGQTARKVLPREGGEP